MARRYLQENLLPGSYWIYACSSHSAAVFDVLETLEGVHFLGFVDRNAATLAEFHGYPVVAPEALQQSTSDRILLAHPKNEDEFASSLMTLGVPDERIFRLYGNPAYREFAVAEHVRGMMERFPGPYDTIIATSLAVVIDDRDLREVFDRQSTLVIYYGEPGRYASEAFDVADAGGSLDVLLQALERYGPKTVYLRTFFDEGFLSYSIPKRLPKAVLVHEMFDMAIVFPDEVLRVWNRWTDAKITNLRLVEWHSLRNSDLVVSKRGGACWETITAIASARPATFFSRVIASERDDAVGADGIPPVPDQPTPIRIVYAGYLPPNPRHVGGYYDLYPCFERLTADGSCIVDIYNAGHRPADDVFYAAYLARQDGGRINYHRATDYNALIREIGRCHFGWLYNERSDIYIHDAAVTIPGRITGYLSAGLPVIIDDEFDFLAGLVRRFNAGIVVPEGRTEMIPELIRTADYPSLKAGAKELLRHMAAGNAAVLQRLRQLKGAGPDRDARK